MNFLVFAAAVATFLVCVRLTRVVPCVEEAAADARQVVGVLSAADIDDAQKEAAARSASLSMLGAFLAILLRSALSFGLPLLAVGLCIYLGLVSSEAMEAAATNLYGLIAAAVATVLAWKLLR